MKTLIMLNVLEMNESLFEKIVSFEKKENIFCVENSGMFFIKTNKSFEDACLVFIGDETEFVKRESQYPMLLTNLTPLRTLDFHIDTVQNDVELKYFISRFEYENRKYQQEQERSLDVEFSVVTPKRVDKILDKISFHGMASLTKREKKILQIASGLD